MPVLTPERIEEVVAGWRLGLDRDGLESPAGPLYPSGYTESEITMTGPAPTMGEPCTYNTFEILSCMFEC